MAGSGKGRLKVLLIAPPVAIGIAVLAWQLSQRQLPEQGEPSEVAKPVRVIEARPVDFVPRALGYGFVQPGSVWEAVAQVSGKIVYRHPDLERGRLLAAGSELLRIDPANYELAVARIEANADAVRAGLEELEVRRANTKSSLEIARRTLALAEQDLARKRTLLAKANVSQTAVDEAESGVLQERRQIQDLQNQLNLLPAERRVLEANLRLNQAQLEEARLDLERTVIRLPFEARIAEVLAEATQFVSAGQKLAVADSIDVAEITAQIALNHMRPLVPAGLDLSSLSADEISALPRRWGFSAEARLVAGDFTASWQARFDRISDMVDPQTRTLGLVVAVDEPYRSAIPGRRPPLTKNMYLEVEIRAAPQPGRIAVPRVALHRGPDGGDVIYLAGAEDRLEFRPVVPGPMQSDFAIVDEGLAGGERVVVSDLIPAIEGMLLAPRADDGLAARLAAQAGGAGELR
jgi:multidrug efflux pump subunit AcrA (membrane-fusion protein)